MAHDSYQLLISLSLDGQLDKEDEDTLYQHMRICALCADTWTRMNSMDRLFSVQREIEPPRQFSLRVMERIEAYEARRLRPWMLIVLGVISLIAAFSLSLPVLLVSVGLPEIVSRSPWIGTALATIANIFTTIVEVATFLMYALIDWLTFLMTDPAALAVVITGLVMASIYIGMREALKLTRSTDSYETA